MDSNDMTLAVKMALNSIQPIQHNVNSEISHKSILYSVVSSQLLRDRFAIEFLDPMDNGCFDTMYLNGTRSYQQQNFRLVHLESIFRQQNVMSAEVLVLTHYQTTNFRLFQSE